MSVIFKNKDCLVLLQELQSNSVELVFTSPPYFNAKDYSQYTSVADYMAQMKKVFEQCFRVLKESRMCIVNISTVIIERNKRSEQSYRIPLPFYYVPMMEELGFEFIEDIIWKKPEGAAKNRNGRFSIDRKPVQYKPNIVTEYLLVFKKKAPFLIDKVLRKDSLVEGDYERTNVWEVNPESNSWHPATFPYELVGKCIRYYSYERETVLDPFTGSGTTAKACIKLKRKFIGAEVNEKYFKKAEEELQSEIAQLMLF